GPLAKPFEPVEFDVPAAATAGGKLTLTWTPEPGAGGPGRGCQVCEVWLLRKPAAPASGAEAGRGSVYSVVEIAFPGPAQTAKDCPARDVDLRVTFRHEDGKAEHLVHGFWDGDGKGGTSGGVFKVRFCPTKAGRWELAEVKSNAKKLDGQRKGDHVTAAA